jgi:glycosyltransferase involved in cell wall biosynthesis
MALALVDAGVTLRWTPIEFDPRRPELPADRPAHRRLDAHRHETARPDVIVLHAIAEIIPAIDRRREGTPLICHTVWEADEIQPHWPDLLNRCDGVIVPTEWNAEVFRAGGVTVPVEVVPHACEPADVAVDTAWLDHLGDRFVVYSVAVWEPRKTPWRSLEAYARALAGRDDVVYVLKSPVRHEDPDPRFRGPAGRERATSWALAMALRDLGTPPPIVLADRYVSDVQLRGLHRRGDCWLSLPHGEGWDLGCFDAAVAGTPVITTGWGAPAEYLDPSASHLVPVTLAPTEVPPDPPHPTRRWAEPDLDAAVAALREVEADRAGARLRAAEQATALRERYAPSAVARSFLAAVERILATT